MFGIANVEPRRRTRSPSCAEVPVGINVMANAIAVSHLRVFTVFTSRWICTSEQVARHHTCDAKRGASVALEPGPKA